MAKTLRKATEGDSTPSGSQEDADKKAAYEAEGEEIQRKIDQKDHGIAELLISNPAITHTEIGNLLGMTRQAISDRRKREVFIRYILWLRRPAIEELQQAGKQAVRRIREAMDAVKDGRGKRPDHWVRITASRMVADILWGRRHRHETRDSKRGNVPGVSPEDLPDLAAGILTGYRAKPKRRTRRRRPARKRKGGKK